MAESIGKDRLFVKAKADKKVKSDSANSEKQIFIAFYPPLY
jgi:hypothetical protein